jgi:hypothetical protein
MWLQYTRGLRFRHGIMVMWLNTTTKEEQQPYSANSTQIDLRKPKTTRSCTACTPVSQSTDYRWRCNTMHWSKMMYVMIHDFCRESCIQKVIMVIHLFSLSKIIWARIEGTTFRCCNQNSPWYKVQHQERIDGLLNDGLKGLLTVIKV